MLHITPEQHFATRMEVHPSQRQPHVQPVSQPLHIVAAVSNPQRYASRYRNYHIFEKAVKDAGAILYTVELALRDRHHEVTTYSDNNHIQLRSESELWVKECLLNIGVSHFSPDWHYGAYIDADMVMTRSDWVAETIHMLQHYNWVQMFSTYSDMLPDHSLGPPYPGFVKLFKEGWAPDGKAPYPYYHDKGALWGAPGGAIAWRREAFDAVGGMLDCCILGSGDYHMMTALCGAPNTHREMRVGTPGYLAAIDHWSKRAEGNKGSMGYVENHAIHLYHGSRAKRGYASRSAILVDYAFDPAADISKDWQFVLRFNGNKPKLEEAVRQYFVSRDEDATT